MAKGSPMGIVTELDIINDSLAATLFKFLTSRPQGSLMHEQASGGTAVALARIPKNVRCHKDSKKNMTPSQEGRISIRTPDQEVGMLHIRAAGRLETHGQSRLHKQMPKSANALGNIQHSLNLELRPLLKQWARDLSLLTSRQIAKQISNHCNQQQIVDSVGQIVRKWANEGPNPFPIALGPIDDKLSLFNLTPANGETKDCIDSTPQRLLLGAVSIILYCDYAVPLNSVCDIYLQITDQAIKNPETNIRLAWAAVTLGNRLLVGLCRCFEAIHTCATQKTGKILSSLKNSHAQIYCKKARQNGENVNPIGAMAFVAGDRSGSWTGDSIQLVTWLHGLPITGAKDFLALSKDSPRATVIHILEGCEQIAFLNLDTQGYLPERPLQGLGGHPTRKQLLLFVLIFERELFPRLTYMKNLITHIHELSEDIPRNTKNVITYDPLPDSEKGNGLYRTLPHQTLQKPHLRPTVKRGIFNNPYAHLPGEQPCKDLEHDDFLELFGHDEELGLSKILLEQGTEIEMPIEDEQGVTFWVAGEVSSYHVGSLDIKAEFPGSILDKGIWK